jgi:cyclopropane-fatty-acyl-phospholipid synthase
MAYTAALYPDDPSVPCTLEEAQLAKIDWHLRAANVKEGDRLLDVGCGWGGLMQRAMETRQPAEAIGLSLSEDQTAWIKEFGDNRISAVTQSWQDYEAVKLFDAVVSLGAIEHFARPEMDRAERTKSYADFYRFCSDNLVEGGMLALQSIVWMNIQPEQERTFLPEHIFPESTLPRVGELTEAFDPWFDMVEMHNRPIDYARTLREWIGGLRRNRERLTRDYNADIVKRYMRGFTLFVMGFENGVIGLTRFSLKKRSSEDLLSSRSRLMRREAESTA